MPTKATSDLQSTYPVFSYDMCAYEIKNGFIEIAYHYTCGDEKLTTIETISGVTEETVLRIPKEELHQYIYQLGLAEILSYWKAFLSPTIEIQCGPLDDYSTQFWQKLCYFGMGEFFYQNNIKPFRPDFTSKNISKFTIQNHSPFSTHHSQQPILVPVGGGKDSIVSLELLAAEGRAIYTWSDLRGASSAVIDLFGKRHPRMGDIVFSRTLDPRLLELNALGHPNGHTPFSSVLAFFSLLTARLYEIPEIAISNESSSNEPTGTWEGIDINHQYSKSVEFERDFQQYVREIFGSGAPHYFSYLRHLNELQITEKFIQFPEYFPVFRSCNVGSKTGTWCGRCGKCAFVALMLSAYLDDETIATIFGRNILEEMELRPHLEALLGMTAFKPFECVGTREESRKAFAAACQRREHRELPALYRGINL